MSQYLIFGIYIFRVQLLSLILFQSYLETTTFRLLIVNEQNGTELSKAKMFGNWHILAVQKRKTWIEQQEPKPTRYSSRKMVKISTIAKFSNVNIKKLRTRSCKIEAPKAAAYYCEETRSGEIPKPFAININNNKKSAKFTINQYLEWSGVVDSFPVLREFIFFIFIFNIEILLLFYHCNNHINMYKASQSTPQDE